MEKIDYFTINEVAKALGVTTRALRYYEQLGLITPGFVDPKTSYRYYNALDLQDILLVLLLKDAGLSLDEILDYIKQAVTPQDKIEQLRKQMKNIEISIDVLKTHCTIRGELQVKRATIPKCICVCQNVIAPDIEAFISIYQACVEKVIRDGWRLSREYPCFCEFPDDAFIDNNLLLKNFPVKICVPIIENNNIDSSLLETFPEEDIVYINFRGSYDELYQAYEALYKFMAKNNLVQAGKAKEYYYDSVNSHFDKDNYLTRVLIPVKPNITV